MNANAVREVVRSGGWGTAKGPTVMNSLDFSLNEQGALWEVLAKESCDLTHILVGLCYGYLE